MDDFYVLLLVIVYMAFLVYIYYFVIYDYHNTLDGIWSATPIFCEQANIGSMMFKVNNKTGTGHITVVGTDNNEIIVDSDFTYTWTEWGKCYTPQLLIKQEMFVIWKDTDIYEKKIYITVDNVNTMTFESADSVYGKLVKIRNLDD